MVRILSLAVAATFLSSVTLALPPRGSICCVASPPPDCCKSGGRRHNFDLRARQNGTAVPPKFVLQIDSTNTDINATFLWINDPDPLSDAMAYTTDAITDATVFSLDGNSYLKLQDGRYAEQDPNLALTSVFFLDAPDIATEGFSYLTCQTDTTNTWLTCQSGANVQLAWCGEYAPNGQDNGYVFSIGPDAGRCSAIQLRVVESM